MVQYAVPRGVRLGPWLGEGSLGGGNPGLAGIDLDGLPQGPRERLEACLDHVVRVGAVPGSEVEGQLRVGGNRAKELLRKLGVEPGDRDRRQVSLEQAERA